MAVYALTSLTSSPGVSTLAAAWAIHSPRPTLIVEADPTGGSTLLTGLWRGTIGHTHSLTALASASPETYGETIWEQAVCLPGRTDRWLLPGIGRGVHASAVRSIWPALSNALRELSRSSGVDVLVDAGRLGLAHGPWTLIDDADAVLVLADATLRSLTSLSVALPSLRADLDLTGSHRRLAVVTRTAATPVTRGLGVLGVSERIPNVRPYNAGEISSAIAPTPVICSLPYDPRAAGVYLDGAGDLDDKLTGSYATAVRHVITATERHAHAYRTLLDTQEMP